MAEASDTLTRDDAVTIQGELIEAQTKSYVLGLALGLQEHEVAAIHQQYQSPEERLLHVIIAFLKKVDPRPTWRVIVNALKSPGVNLPALALRVERAHFPSVQAQSSIGSCPNQDHLALATVSGAAAQELSTREVKKMIADMKGKFEELKDVILKCLNKQNILVKKVAGVLTSLSPDDDDRHKLFLEGHVEVLFNAANHNQLFGTMNFHWNYLDPSLLDNLVQLLKLYEVKNELDSYNSDLQLFRKKIPLTMYCQVQRRKKLRLTPEFRELVVELDIPEHVELMLEDVEQLRLDYASHYGLHEFAMMLSQVKPGSFIITWFIPESIVEKLKGNVPETILKKYSVTKLEIDGDCVYNTCKIAEIGPGNQSTIKSHPRQLTATEGVKRLVLEEHLYVEKPSEDYFCPVTTEILLQPHLTSCCGHHLSQEAATRVQEEGWTCPICKHREWSTLLDKNFQRQVMSLHVYCRHKESGCKWQGELREMESHACNCPMRFGPLMTNLQYRIEGIIFARFESNICQVSGPGLTSATVNHPTHVLVEITDSNGRPLPLQLNVTAQLEYVHKATPTNQPTTTSLPVVVKSPSRYEVSYTAVSQGQHKLHVQVNDREINGSPFRVTVYPDPRQLDNPVRTVTGLNTPYGIAFNSHGQMIVSEHWGHKVSILDMRGKKIRIFGSEGDRPDQMNNPAGIATDDADNIYVSCQHKLQKFTSNGELIKCIGQKGNKEGEFNDPRGITVYNNQLYICDTDNHRIQVFDLDLNFVRSIGSYGEGRGEFDRPYDVKFDTAGNMCVTEFSNRRVQVLDSSGRFIRSLGQEEGKGKLKWPSGLHIVDKYVYVSDRGSHCIVVYETSGQFVTLFGRYGSNDGEFDWPSCITSDVDGFIYVCDFDNNRVQIF